MASCWQTILSHLLCEPGQCLASIRVPDSSYILQQRLRDSIEGTQASCAE